MNTKSLLTLSFAVLSVAVLASPVEAKPKGSVMDPNEVIDACSRSSDCQMSVEDDGTVSGSTSNGVFGCSRLNDYRNWDGTPTFYCLYGSFEDDDDEGEEEE